MTGWKTYVEPAADAYDAYDEEVEEDEYGDYDENFSMEDMPDIYGEL